LRARSGRSGRARLESTLGTSPRTQELQGGAHALFERSVGKGLGELGGAPSLIGAKSELSQARHDVGRGLPVPANVCLSSCGIRARSARSKTSARSPAGTTWLSNAWAYCSRS